MALLLTAGVIFNSHAMGSRDTAGDNHTTRGDANALNLDGVNIDDNPPYVWNGITAIINHIDQTADNVGVDVTSSEYHDFILAEIELLKQSPNNPAGEVFEEGAMWAYPDTLARFKAAFDIEISLEALATSQIKTALMNAPAEAEATYGR